MRYENGHQSAPWTRFLIANLVLPEKASDFANINELIPRSGRNSKAPSRAVAASRYLKSHQYFDPRYPKIIHIVRDPRDVVLFGILL